MTKAAGLSKFPLTRTFLATTERTVLACRRAQRLSEAVKLIQRGVRRIPDAALSVVYGSHEAFSGALLKMMRLGVPVSVAVAIG